MANTQAVIEQELKHIRKDVELIKYLLSEDFELSKEAKVTLKEARKTSELKYVDLA